MGKRRTQTLRPRSAWATVMAAAGVAFSIVLAAVVAAVVVVPRATGGASLAVLTGSMTPALAPGDLAVVRGIAPGDVCSQVGIGQVITYLPNPLDPSLITHRVVAKTVGTYPDGSACRLVTQGDANTAPDKPISPAQVRGVLLYSVPKLGWVREWAGEHTLVVVIAGGLAAVAYLIWTSVRPARTRVVRTIPNPDYVAARRAYPEPGGGA